MRDFGTKRVARTTVSKVTPQTMAFFGRFNVCYGDSGGPSMVEDGAGERVAGVHSMKLGDCGDVGVDVRVDAFVPWILEVSDGGVTVVGQGIHVGTEDQCITSFDCQTGEVCDGFPIRTCNPGA